MAELLSACSQDEEEESALISNQGELGSLTGKEQTVVKTQGQEKVTALFANPVSWFSTQTQYF